MKIRHMLAALAVTTGLLSAIPAFAAWSSVFKPTKVYTGYVSGAVYIEGANNLGGCSSSLIEFLPATSDPDKILPMATAALLAGRNLKCNVSGCNGSYQKGDRCYIEQ